MDQPLQPIQPAPGVAQLGPHGRLLKRLRPPRPNACQPCRVRKSRCNGGTPKCDGCIKRDTDCVYLVNRVRSLQTQLREFQTLVGVLRNSSEPEAGDILKQIRNTDDIPQLVSSLNGSMHKRYRPSILRTVRAVAAPTFSGLELELMVRHTIAYPAIPPLDAESRSFNPLLKPSLHPEGPLQHVQVKNEVSSAGPSSQPVNHVDPANLTTGPDRQSSPLPKLDPELAERSVIGISGSKYCDERLDHLRIGYWTSVPIDDDFAASVISYYLEVNHPANGFFDAELFVQDLVEHRSRFCSTFFVHALLAWACSTYVMVDERAISLGSTFLSKAKELWRVERSTDAILNVPALLLLYSSSTIHAGDIELIEEARQMAQRLRLLGVPHTAANAAGFREMTDDWKRAAAHVAWGIYGLLTMHVFYCPIEPVLFHPMLPVPGANTSTAVFDEKLQIKWPPHALPTYCGQTLPAVYALHKVMQEVAGIYFANRLESRSDSSRPPLSFAEAKFRQLLVIADSLPPDVCLKDINADHVIAFHILFHSAVLDIFLPFVHGTEDLPLPSFSSPNSSVKAAIRASTNQLKRLMVISRIDNPRTLSIPITNTAVPHVSNVMLRDAASERRLAPVQGDGDDANREFDPDWRFYFLLCIASLQDGVKCFPVYGSVGKGLLTMAMRDGIMASEEAQSLLRVMEVRGEKHNLVSDQPIGSFVIDLDLALKAPSDAQAKVMATKFDEFVSFSDYTMVHDFVVEDNLVLESGSWIDN